MNPFCKYLLIILGLAALGYILWYFSSIVAYIIIAGILSLIGRPVVDILCKIKYYSFRFPRWVAALVTLVLLWVFVIGFFRIFIPLIANQANELSQIEIDPILDILEKPINRIENIYYEYNSGNEDVPAFEDFINDKIRSVLNISFVSNFFSSIFNILGNLFIAIFAISFIGFFFLKDQSMFADNIVLLIPEKHEKAIRNALSSTRYLLMRYFIGICAQITAIMTLVTIGMVIIGIGFKHALLIALVIGLLNVIPYVGPWLGGFIGVLLVVATHLHLDFGSEVLPLIGYMVIVILIVQATDNVLFQPLIFSSSVKSHPLEIFLVIMIAGTLAGIPGMILGIPAYTVIRVFAKEFLSKFRVVKKLTRNI